MAVSAHFTAGTLPRPTNAFPFFNAQQQPPANKGFFGTHFGGGEKGGADGEGKREGGEVVFEENEWEEVESKIRMVEAGMWIVMDQPRWLGQGEIRRRYPIDLLPLKSLFVISEIFRSEYARTLLQTETSMTWGFNEFLEAEPFRPHPLMSDRKKKITLEPRNFVERTISACYETVCGKLIIEPLWFLKHLCVIVGFALRRQLIPKFCVHDVKCILMYVAALNNPPLGNETFQIRIKQTLFVLQMAEAGKPQWQQFVANNVGDVGALRTMVFAPNWLETVKMDFHHLVQPISGEDFVNMKSSMEYLRTTEFTEQELLNSREWFRLPWSIRHVQSMQTLGFRPYQSRYSSPSTPEDERLCPRFAASYFKSLVKKCPGGLLSIPVQKLLVTMFNNSHIITEEYLSFIRLILSIEATRALILADLAHVGLRILRAGATQQIHASDLAKVMPVFIEGRGAGWAAKDSTSISSSSFGSSLKPTMGGSQQQQQQLNASAGNLMMGMAGTGVQGAQQQGQSGATAPEPAPGTLEAILLAAAKMSTNKDGSGAGGGAAAAAGETASVGSGSGAVGDNREVMRGLTDEMNQWQFVWGLVMANADLFFETELDNNMAEFSQYTNMAYCVLEDIRKRAS
ncbi:hypothetical protein HK102_006817 [Quaeritorhiza haematococci]|nr:hypothetical protein HK102_006817 [Quaeritorhiza haematococci]